MCANAVREMEYEHAKFVHVTMNTSLEYKCRSPMNGKQTTEKINARAFAGGNVVFVEAVYTVRPGVVLGGVSQRFLPH